MILSEKKNNVIQAVRVKTFGNKAELEPGEQ
jgi:hypothetical protein